MNREIAKKYTTIVIGGGPAGLSAAVAAGKENESVLIIEREARLGGILKQCIHDGFGVIRFGEKLSGPEYAERYVEEVEKLKNVDVKTLSFVIKIEKLGQNFLVYTTGKEGIAVYEGRSLILANGCRERTPRQVNIHGTRPAGVMTAGVAQNFVNILGYLPTKKCVILGSGDIGLIMARRLTLEGAKVLGVYEAKSTPSGLTRNVCQCLNDFNIPLHLSKTVTKVFGNERLEAVEISSVDDKMQPIKGTEEIIECDALIVSVGLIPENELAEGLGIVMDKATKGPKVDQNMMTSEDGIYSVGNALHVHDLVDYVSETAETAGKHSVGDREERKLISVETSGFLYLVPQSVNVNDVHDKTVMYFRSAKNIAHAIFRVFVGAEEVFSKEYRNLKPPEMERVVVSLKKPEANQGIRCVLEEKND